MVSTEVQAEQATRVPGTQGDVLKVVENLPGVARSAAGAGTLVVWGSAPQDTRVYVDGVHVPRLYHDGGYRSIVSSDFVRSVELVPDGYGPPYGRGLEAWSWWRSARSTKRAFTGAWPPTRSTRRRPCARRPPSTFTSPSPRERAGSTPSCAA